MKWQSPIISTIITSFLTVLFGYLLDNKFGIMFWLFISVGIIITGIIWATFIVMNELKKIKDDIVFHDAVYNSVFENIKDGLDINTGKEDKIISKLRWRFGNDEIQKRMSEYFTKK